MSGRVKSAFMSVVIMFLFLYLCLLPLRWDLCDENDYISKEISLGEVLPGTSLRFVEPGITIGHPSIFSFFLEDPTTGAKTQYSYSGIYPVKIDKYYVTLSEYWQNGSLIKEKMRLKLTFLRDDSSTRFLRKLYFCSFFR